MACSFFVAFSSYKDLGSPMSRSAGTLRLTSATVMVIVGTATVFGRVLAIRHPVSWPTDRGLTSDPMLICC